MVPPFNFPEFSFKLPDVLGGHVTFPYKPVDQAVELLNFEFVQPDILVDLDALFKAHGAPTGLRNSIF